MANTLGDSVWGPRDAQVRFYGEKEGLELSFTNHNNIVLLAMYIPHLKQFCEHFITETRSDYVFTTCHWTDSVLGPHAARVSFLRGKRGARTYFY